MTRCFSYILFIIAIIISLVILWTSNTAHAHKLDYGVIETDLSIKDGNKVVFTIDTVDPIAISDNYQDDKKLPPAQVDKYYADYFADNFSLKNFEKLCPVHLNSYSISNIRSNFQGYFQCEDNIDNINNIAISSKLFHNHYGRYDNYVNLSIENTLWELLFTKDKTEYPGDVTASQVSKGNLKTVIFSFFKLGVEHIWKGYDHLLFLITAILLLRKLKDFLVVVTSFTVAHSITLGLAAFDILTLSPRIIEPIIVFSILCIALRNLYLLRRKNEHINISERWIIAFGFGLLHGLGFAGALKDNGIPEQYFAAAIGSFNIGIEAGQLAVLIIVVPALVLFFKYNKRDLILTILTIVIAIAAAFMTVQRILAG